MKAEHTSGAGAGIQDVAREARVSPSTVSRVLNQAASGVTISPATVARVRAAAAKLHYRPNASARSLRTAKTQTVGVIVRDLTAPYSPEFLHVIYTVCRERGYHVLVGNTQRNTEEGWALGDILSPDRVDGILLQGDVLPPSISEEAMRVFVRDHRHVVGVGCPPTLAGEVSIMVDNALGVTLALDHLYDQGHRCIAYLGATEAPQSWEDALRWQTFSAFMAAHDLPVGPDYGAVIRGSNLPAAHTALRHFLSAPERPTAVFASNDLSALLLLRAALLGGLLVPDDLSIIGFDDISYAALSTPGLTTIRQPIEDIARYAAGVLLDRIAGVEPSSTLQEGDGAPQTVLFTPTLIRRESVHPYRR